VLLSWQRPETEGGEAVSGYTVEQHAGGAAADGAWRAVHATEQRQQAISCLWEMWLGACGVQTPTVAPALAGPLSSAAPLCCVLDFGSYAMHDVRVAAVNSAGASLYALTRVWPMPSRPAPPTALELGPAGSARTTLRCA
jgi:hypothetical protein